MSPPTRTPSQPVSQPSSPSSSQDSPGQVTNAHWSQRLRRWRPVLIALSLILISALIKIWTTPATSSTPLAIDNPKKTGTMALAELLRDEGISVSKADSVSAALAASRRGATVAVVNADALGQEERESLAQAGGDVVVIGAKSGSNALSGLTDMASKGEAAPATAILEPECSDDDARAAQALAGESASVSLQGDDDAVGCFPVDEDRYAYATDVLPSGATLRVIADPSPVTNEHLAQEGHAALGVRALGHHDQVVWLDGGNLKATSVWNSPSTPRWLPVVILQLILIGGVLAVVKGRRLGGVITEDLPVVVRSTETTIARGRLYRQGSDRPRAAEALRSGAALRLGTALGMASGTSRRDMVAAVAQASGTDPSVVDSLLYGPPPTSDGDLATLALQLDQLESEVHSQ